MDRILWREINSVTTPEQIEIIRGITRGLNMNLIEDKHLLLHKSLGSAQNKPNWTLATSDIISLAHGGSSTTST